MSSNGRSVRRLLNRSVQILAHHLNSWQQLMHDKSVLEMARNRTLVMGGVFCLAFLLVTIRLFDVMVLHSHNDEMVEDVILAEQDTSHRADIVDRNGEILATHLVTASVYANPKVILNAEDAALKLSTLMPDLDYETVLKKLKSDKGFIWIVRHIPPKLQHEMNLLGIPGVYLQKDQRRVYPHGNLVSHVLGYCGIDNLGLAGIEKQFDVRLRKDSKPLQLGLDVRVQHIVRDELSKAVLEFRAEGANAMVMEVETGEILAMVSLPDYDPNLPNQNAVEATFNKNTLGIYESGSVFKIFNTAIALESGKAKLATLYDASAPIRVGSKKITDFKGKNRPLEVREVFIYSSNIGSAKMALDFGSEMQRQYLGRLGLLSAPMLELPEIGAPLVPKTWSDVTTMTVSYGYGIAVSPLMLVDAVRTVITGIKKFSATMLKRDPSTLDQVEGQQIISPKTAEHIRNLMRLVVTEGTAKKADVPGYEVFGKTGTAHRNKGRSGYNNSRRTTFIGAFPKSNPKYILILFMDDPKPTKETYGYATGGWTAAPVSGRIISRMAPLLDVQPVFDDNQGDHLGGSIIPISHKIQ
ncbi:peptidoglycan D,D-transpeptidase FtsI family protein [Candidatus Paracaedibacter symbiosus]|uniref:peptidoglycan D,D-transpeptidase FtsI family protein n=1 Tax=Candidatus Paracaedibacter symbiosus TaxID=244582 RepID=UPI0006900EEC|nr:penicillin-binding protein 2 [Candidatus Paracaedibacter symbiosus]